MPRQMPRLDRALSTQAQTAISIVRAGELARNSADPNVRSQWTPTKLEALYELAYLRAFIAWESCLEAIFYRSLCGFASRTGQELLVAGKVGIGPSGFYRTIADAELAVCGTGYALWYVDRVLPRCASYIQNGSGRPNTQATVLNSSKARLKHLEAIRHRVAHDHRDARQKFDAATVFFAGRTYSTSRPGKFLADWDTSTPRQRWLEAILTELIALTGQMV